MSTSCFLFYFISLMIVFLILQTFQELETLSGFKTKIQRCTELVKKTVVDYPTEEVEASMESFYMKLRAAHYYAPDTKIKSSVVLIKPTENYTKLAEDYGLSNVRASLTIIFFSV